MRKILILACLLAPNAFAADVIAIKAARLIDGRSDAVIAPAVVIVRANKIEQVGRDVAIPKGAQVIDLGDKTLLPGLIDAHVHILLQGDVTTEDYDS